MNFESLTLSDLAPLLAQAKCPCHIINPSKTRIILWKEVKGDQETYYLRIGIQKFISYPLTDKNQAIYWRFQGYEKVNNQPHESINHSEQSESVSH